MSVAIPSPMSVSVTAESLRDLRKARGLTQAAVAELIGIPKEQVCRIETGQRGLTHAEKLVLEAALLGLPVPAII
jgi:transcriptional regulator with XRE-family HTH domain